LDKTKLSNSDSIFIVLRTFNKNGILIGLILKTCKIVHVIFSNPVLVQTGRLQKAGKLSYDRVVLYIEKRLDSLEEIDMFTTILFTLLLALVFWALVRTTEKVLAIRQSKREKGEKPIVYL
jgi:hypothetical protein